MMTYNTLFHCCPVLLTNVVGLRIKQYIVVVAWLDIWIVRFIIAEIKREVK